MGNCVSHERCPSCAKHGRDRSGNNLGVYDDGSAYCFSCHYRRSANLYLNLEARSQGCTESGDRSTAHNRTNEGSNRCPLPKDSIGLLDENTPLYALDWVLQYGLTTKEITDNLLLFSETGVYLQKKQELVCPLVIFPVYGDGELLFWTGRNLAYKGIGTKWTIKGKKADIIHCIYPDQGGFQSTHSTCCVCEDVISSIKLGRIIPTYTLFGKSVSPELLKYLSSNYHELLIYLDFDAIDTMVKLQQQFKPYFHSVRIIISPLDPKLYNTEELRDIIK